MMQIEVEHHDGVALLRLDDGKKNAITASALADIEAALTEAEGASAIVLAGRPGAFCAGFDVAVMTGDDAAAKQVLGQGGARIAARLFRCPKPVVAASTGHAFTIGALWLMASDTRIGARGAFKYAMTETVMGAVLSDWTMALLESRVPPRLMTAITVQSRVMSPEEALEAGFVDALVDPDEVIATALETAASLAALPAAAYAGNKASLRAAAMARIDAELEAWSSERP